MRAPSSTIKHKRRSLPVTYWEPAPPTLKNSSKPITTLGPILTTDSQILVHFFFFFALAKLALNPMKLDTREIDDTIFLPLYKIIVFFFPFSSQDANKTGSKCAKIGCNLSKKRKLSLYKTQGGEPNYADHKFYLMFC